MTNAILATDDYPEPCDRCSAAHVVVGYMPAAGLCPSCLVDPKPAPCWYINWCMNLDGEQEDYPPEAIDPAYWLEPVWPDPVMNDAGGFEYPMEVG